MNELYTYNEVDFCWDPIGAIDKDGMTRLIEVIARGKLPKDRVLLANEVFKKRKQ